MSKREPSGSETNALVISVHLSVNSMSQAGAEPNSFSSRIGATHRVHL